jgi:hypothetical protein
MTTKVNLPVVKHTDGEDDGRDQGYLCQETIPKFQALVPLSTSTLLQVLLELRIHKPCSS